MDKRIAAAGHEIGLHGPLCSPSWRSMTMQAPHLS
jgi:hypothetical protein